MSVNEIGEITSDFMIFISLSTDALSVPSISSNVSSLARVISIAFSVFIFFRSALVLASMSMNFSLAFRAAASIKVSTELLDE